MWISPEKRAKTGSGVTRDEATECDSNRTYYLLPTQNALTFATWCSMFVLRLVKCFFGDNYVYTIDTLDIFSHIVRREKDENICCRLHDLYRGGGQRFLRSCMPRRLIPPSWRFSAYSSPTMIP